MWVDATASNSKQILAIVRNGYADSCTSCTAWEAALYDLATDRWTPLPDAALAPLRAFDFGDLHAAATTRGWIVWGTGVGPEEIPGAYGAEYIPATGTWRTFAQPSSSFPAVLTWSDSLGSLVALVHQSVVDDKTDAVHEYLQPFVRDEAGAWTPRALKAWDGEAWPPTTPVWLGTKMYAGKHLYDVSSDAWSELAAFPKVATRYALAVPECQSVAYFASSRPIYEDESAGAYWDSAASRWRELPDLADLGGERSSIGVLNGKMIVWSSWDIPAHGTAHRHSIRGVYDFATAAWSSVAGLGPDEVFTPPISTGCELIYISPRTDGTWVSFAYGP